MTVTRTQAWRLVERRQRIMATGMSIHLSVRVGDEERADRAIAACFEWLEELGRQLTRFEPTSDLSQLNQASGHWHPTPEPLYSVVEQSIAAAEASDGLFHPATLPALEAAGYDRDVDEIAQREIGHETLPVTLADWRDIALDPRGRRVRLPAGAKLDLGGIVKGWAADSALERFFADFDNVLINAGGDMRARGGPQPDTAWALGIADPRTPPAEGEQDAGDAAAAHIAVVSLAQGGSATSGATERWWYAGGAMRHHLIDPRTGLPARVWVNSGGAHAPNAPDPDLIATATAFAPTAAHAEVAAKVALLRGYPEALERVERAWKRHRGSPQPPYGDGGVALLLVKGSGEICYSAHLESYLSTHGGGGNVWLS